MIHAEHLTKTFGHVCALSNVSLNLDAGASMALWGSNGAGKTTLIRCLLGVVPFIGHVTIGGIDVRRRGRHARALVGYVPQELAFHDDARLDSTMTFFAKLRSISRTRAAESLDLVGLNGHERKRVRDLSGGMKQRLALAIAMLSNPPLIILDEPTSNLDAVARGEVVQTLRRLRENGKTLLFASHRPDEIISLAETVLVLDRGRVVQATSPAQLWPTEKPIQVVRLFLAMASEEHAAQVLRNAGLAVNLNGHGLCVAVPRDRKAEPIALLAKNMIEVRDIEVLEYAQIPGGAT